MKLSYRGTKYELPASLAAREEGKITGHYRGATLQLPVSESQQAQSSLQ